jgi:hypothetical protein
MEIERAAQKLLAQLAIQSASAKTYVSPLGPRERDEAKVRTALAALRDPEERALHELWAAAPAADEPAKSSAWNDAFASIGWKAPWNSAAFRPRSHADRSLPAERASEQHRPVRSRKQHQCGAALRHGRDSGALARRREARFFRRCCSSSLFRSCS